MDASTMTPLWKLDAGPAPAGTPFAPGAHHDVVVVGAGLTGLCTAVTLARAGLDVAVVEAGGIGELASGGNTGKLSLLQGSVLSGLRRHHPASLVRAYVDANRDGAAWLTDFADSAGVTYTRRLACSYAPSPDDVETVEAEAEAAREAGLPVRRPEPGELVTSFPLTDAVVLDDQVAIDPYAVVLALASAFLAAGGTLHTGVRATHVHTAPHVRLETTAGSVSATDIVLTTGAPITDRGFYFAKTRGLRSHCVAFDVPGDLPDGLYLSVGGGPTRSIRSVTAADGPQRARLVVGGNGHPVGRAESDLAEVDGLVTWAQEHFPGAREVARWSAQDYESHDLIPFVGVMPRSLGRVRFATGFGKWGLALAPAAALRISAEITRMPWRERPVWMRTIARRFTVPADIGRAGVENLRIGWEAASGWVGAQQHHVPVPRPAEGEGVVATRAGAPVGISTVDGVTRAVSARCTHLGGTLSWNDAECTWDCPLHASRFRADGTRIEGPAVHDLERMPRVRGEAVTEDHETSAASVADE